MKTKPRIAMPIIGDDIESLELVKDGGKNTGIRVHNKADRQGQMQAMVDSDFYLVRKNEELFAYKPKKTSILFRLQPSEEKYRPFLFVIPIKAVISISVNPIGIRQFCRRLINRAGRNKWNSNVMKHFVLRNMATDL